MVAVSGASRVGGLLIGGLFLALLGGCGSESSGSTSVSGDAPTTVAEVQSQTTQADSSSGTADCVDAEILGAFVTAKVAAIPDYIERDLVVYSCGDGAAIVQSAGGPEVGEAEDSLMLSIDGQWTFVSAGGSAYGLEEVCLDVDFATYPKEQQAAVENWCQATTAAPTTAAPTTILVPARCVTEEINLSTQGRRDEIALYQQTLKDLGYDPGDVDGYFGPKSFNAAFEEIVANGNIDGPEGIFQEAFLDDGAVLLPAFDRLGISCLVLQGDAEEQ
jgi:hypothetical protein